MIIYVINDHTNKYKLTSRWNNNKQNVSNTTFNYIDVDFKFDDDYYKLLINNENSKEERIIVLSIKIYFSIRFDLIKLNQ
jgi:hypothetical protein